MITGSCWVTWRNSELARNAVKSFGEGSEFFEDRTDLVNKIKNEMQKDTVILVKGSRGMAMEKVVFGLLDVNKNKNRQGVN